MNLALRSNDRILVPYSHILYRIPRTRGSTKGMGEALGSHLPGYLNHNAWEFHVHTFFGKKFLRYHVSITRHAHGVYSM